MREYFTHNGSSQTGPFKLEELKLQQLKEETPIWYEGLENWTTASDVEELKYLFIKKVVPPPINISQETTTTGIPKIENHQVLQPKNVSLTTNKKKLNTIILLILGGIFFIGLIVWLVTQHNSKEDEIGALPNQETKGTTQSTNRAQAQQTSTQQSVEEQRERQKLQDDKARQIEKDKINTQLTEKFMGYRNNWMNFITASTNNYTYTDMGGISNLEIEVYNQTDRIIDEVQVRIDYIKATGGVFKSEMVSVSNIGPNGAKSVSAPSSDRGTSVKTEIINISASSFHFCYPDGMNGNKNFDPYYCN